MFPFRLFTTTGKVVARLDSLSSESVQTTIVLGREHQSREGHIVNGVTYAASRVERQQSLGLLRRNDKPYHCLGIKERAVMELLEREQPLDQLGEQWRHAAAGHGRLVLVGGEAGVGKTTLVEEFAAASPRQRRCCGPRATRSPRRVRSVPYAIWRPLSVSIDEPPSTGRPGPAVPRRAGGPCCATRADGDRGRRRPLGGRRDDRVAALSWSADWRSPGPRRRHVP